MTCQLLLQPLLVANRRLAAFLRAVGSWHAGRSTLPILDHQRVTLNRDTGNISFHSRPIIQYGPHGEFSIAEMKWDSVNQWESDGSPYIRVRVTHHRFISDLSAICSH